MSVAPSPPDTALRPSRNSGNSPELWMDIQAAYDLRTTAQAVADTLEQIAPRAA